MTTRKLKVYGWQSHHRTGQVRMIVAAPSQAAVARLAGYKRPSQLFNLSETRNATEREVALSAPGRIFWTTMRTYGEPYQPLDE